MERWEPPHDPTETETREISFDERLTALEEIASVTFTPVPAGGSHLSQVSADISADKRSALWRFSGGTHGTDYEVTARATTSLGNALEETIILRCRDR